MEPESLVQIGIFCFLTGAALAVFLPPKVKNYTYILPSVGALLFLSAGFSASSVLPGGVSLGPVSLPISSIFSFEFRGDSLSAFFVIVISVLTFAVSVYSIGYTSGTKRGGLMGLLFNFFIMSMYGVVLSGNIVTFLVAWETMSIVSYFLVTSERDETSAKAGLIYAVMTHIGTAFIIVLFLVLFRYTGYQDFPGMKSAAGNIPGDVKTVIFLFSIIGFGMKAGIVPLHTWLPRAHPAAPSNISALMSGVMIKTGIYGFLRISFDLMGSGPEWWGITVIVIGAVSSVFGVLYALMEQDMKRLLAYSSVENIGIILLGIGASMVFRSSGLSVLSSVALTAALYHVMNHAMFKGLLFLGSGSVMHATHTKNMEHMGGLIKAMPYTGLFFLIGSVSICALPPFNGFVSEWLTFQSLILGANVPSVTSKIISPLGGAALALTGALAAAGFVKAFGISFLGAPRSAQAEKAKESGPAMVTGMALLGLLCLLMGLSPDFVVSVISTPVQALTGGPGVSSWPGFLNVSESAATLSPFSILAAMTVILAAAGFFIIVVGGRRKITRAGSWDCGMTALTPRMQYSATAFTKPIRMIFKNIYLPSRDLKVSYIVKPFFVRSIRYRGEISPFVEKYLYGPVIDFVHATARKVRLLQSGSLHLYLGYILITLILLLIFGT